MNESAALIARRTQAARDALRRRQKEKKARIVKRHVRYKQKQKLLSQLQLSEREEPIVAPEFATLHHEEAERREQEPTDVNGKTQIEISASEEETEHLHKSSSEELRKGESEAMDHADDTTEPKRNTRKYMPFAKERKQFKEMKEKREQEQKEREERIKQRESMLKSSKKRRKKQAKQYRAVTQRGQPKMKHRVDALLARIEKQQ
ncbi:rRNA-processing protein FYV7 [Gracilaria domingensis]|nr:rRNA-processing protein FYV7 [Gracilaria domingensis]